MGWEKRIFFRKPQAIEHEFILPDPKARPNVEARTDTYHPHSAQVGIKERGGTSSGFEVKHREKVDDDKFEKWQKYKLGDERRVDGLLEQLKQPLEHAARQHEVTVAKRRQQWMDGGALAEETVVRVSMLVTNAHGESTVVEEVWTTVCVEGKRKACGPVLTKLMAQCREQCGEGFVSTMVQCGYPAWVRSVAERLTAGASSFNLAVSVRLNLEGDEDGLDGLAADHPTSGPGGGGEVGGPVFGALQSLPMPAAPGMHGPVGAPVSSGLMKNRAADRMADRASFGIGGTIGDFSAGGNGVGVGVGGGGNGGSGGGFDGGGGGDGSGRMDSARGQKRSSVGAVGQEFMGGSHDSKSNTLRAHVNHHGEQIFNDAVQANQMATSPVSPPAVGGAGGGGGGVGGLWRPASNSSMGVGGGGGGEGFRRSSVASRRSSAHSERRSSTGGVRDDTRIAFRTHGFSIVVCQHPTTGCFLAVKESRGRGWWLPAGHVDRGQTFAEAARREALEESGIEVDLVGILGVEHTLKGPLGEEEDARMRVIYYARPAKGKSDKPKSKPDEESDGAAWMTIEQLERLATKPPPAGLRGQELLRWGKHVEAGGPVFPMALIGEESQGPSLSLASTAESASCGVQRGVLANHSSR